MFICLCAVSVMYISTHIYFTELVFYPCSFNFHLCNHSKRIKILIVYLKFIFKNAISNIFFITVPLLGYQLQFILKVIQFKRVHVYIDLSEMFSKTCEPITDKLTNKIAK